MHTIKEPEWKHALLQFLPDESGAIEYGLIAAGISLAMIAVVNGLGSNLAANSPQSITC